MRLGLAEGFFGELAGHLAGERDEFTLFDAELPHHLAALSALLREMHPVVGDPFEEELEGDLVAADFGQVLHELISFLYCSIYIDICQTYQF